MAPSTQPAIQPAIQPAAQLAPLAPLAALCAVARFHQVAADPATLAHQLGLSPNQPLAAADLVHAARHLGLKAKLTRTRPDRLALTPLPAWALMHSALQADNGVEHGTPTPSLHAVILAQCDGQRVLYQDPSASPAPGVWGGYRPRCWPLH